MTSTDNKSETDETLDTGLSLVLYNDHHNSFDHVIRSLMQVLDWTAQQSEQIATLAHHRGKVRLKSGDYQELEKFKYQLEARDLTVEIV